MESTQDPPSEPDPPSESIPASTATYHDKAEVLAAFRALTDIEMRRLVSFARYRMTPINNRLDTSSAMDLLHEALVKTLDGTRKWRCGVTFPQHLFGCMRSIAHNWFEQAGRHAELSDAHASALPGPDVVYDAKETLDELRKQLEGNSTALKVLDSLLDGRNAAEAQERLDITHDIYAAAVKYIRRKADIIGFSKRAGSDLKKAYAMVRSRRRE